MNLSRLVARPAFLPVFNDWAAIRGARIAITGASGTLGSLLCERLAASGLTFSCFDGDVTDAARLAAWIAHTRPTGLFHLAAIVPLGAVDADPARAMAVNATSLLTLASAVATHAPDCWVFYASTSHVYGSSDLPLDEASAIRPISLYGATKLAGEAILGPLACRLGIRLCVGRIFSYFHERQDSSFLVPGLVQRITAAPIGGRVEVRNANSRRDFLHAAMVVDAMLHALSRRIDCSLNIASGESISVLEIAERLTVISGKEVELVPVESDHMTSIVADILRLRAMTGKGPD